METAGERQILGYFLKCSNEASWHYCAFYTDRNYQQYKMQLRILKATVEGKLKASLKAAWILTGHDFATSNYTFS